MFVFVWSQAAGELHVKTKIHLKCVYLSRNVLSVYVCVCDLLHADSIMFIP